MSDVKTEEKPKPKAPFSVYAALKLRFEGEEWATLREVCATVGGGRRADLIAMNMWRSRGWEIHGVEVKVSRNDWLRELKNPSKAESCFMHCHRWWLAVSDESIVKDGELPSPWGLLVPRGNTLVAKVPAPKLEPRPLNYAFVASLLRCACDQLVKQSPHEQELRDKWQQGWNEGRANRQSEIDHIQKEFDRYKETLKDFEKASGLNLSDRYNHFRQERIAEAARLFADKRSLEATTQALKHEMESLNLLGTQITALMDVLKLIDHNAPENFIYGAGI